MKKTKKLELKKVTLRDLDEPKLKAMAGGTGPTASCTCTCSGGGGRPSQHCCL